MLIQLFVTTLICVSMVTAEVGYGGNNDEVWAYQWYEDEPFTMFCNSSKLNITVNDELEWETPNKMKLRNGQSNEYFELKQVESYQNMALYIKKVMPELHGVYICSVMEPGKTTPRTRMIIGLNVHEEKYRKLFDKYRDNLIVAVIATAVFIVPLGTSCFVYHFQYETPEDKAKKQRRRLGKTEQKYASNDNYDLPMKSTEKIAGGAVEVNGKDGYENPNFSTQL